MDIKVIIALIIAIPVILFPAAFVWFLNISGLYAVAREYIRKKIKVKQ